MKVTVDHDRCQGHAMCITYAPEIFQLNDDGYNRMEPFEVRSGQEDLATKAARMCPERAIKLTPA